MQIILHILWRTCAYISATRYAIRFALIKKYNFKVTNFTQILKTFIDQSSFLFNEHQLLLIMFLLFDKLEDENLGNIIFTAFLNFSTASIRSPPQNIFFLHTSSLANLCGISTYCALCFDPSAVPKWPYILFFWLQALTWFQPVTLSTSNILNKTLLKTFPNSHLPSSFLMVV